MTEDELRPLLEPLTLFLVPDNMVRLDFGFALGKWNCWAQIGGYWYRGTAERIQHAYEQMLENFQKDAHVAKVAPTLDGRRTVSPTDGRRKENKETTLDEIKDMF